MNWKGINFLNFRFFFIDSKFLSSVISKRGHIKSKCKTLVRFFFYFSAIRLLFVSTQRFIFILYFILQIIILLYHKF